MNGPLSKVKVWMEDGEIIEILVNGKYEDVSADMSEAWNSFDREDYTESIYIHGIDELEILPAHEIKRISVERVCN